MATQRDVAAIAEAAVQARLVGKTTYAHGQTVIDLDEPDYCARKVRQWHEAAMELAPWRWEFSSPNAMHMESILRTARKRVDEPERGDILFFNREGGPHGHVGIFLGGGDVVEGTTATDRGKPRAAGVKISRIAEIGARRITGCYRTLARARELRLVNEDAPKGRRIVECGLRIENGVARANVRELLQALGYIVNASRLLTDGKISVRRKP